MAYNPLKIGENWDEKSAFELLNYFLKEQADLFFVADDGKAVGAIVAQVRPWWDGNHLIEGELFLHPSYQGKRIGVGLVKKLFTEAKKKYQVVAWDTYTHVVHENPLAWYKKLGFEEIKNWRMITRNVDVVLKKIKV